MFFGWGIARLIHAPPELRWSVPVAGATLLHWTVAWLFANRAVAKSEGNLADLGVASVSLIAGALLLAMLPQRRVGGSVLSVLFIAVGSVVTIVALLKLGRSFAIFPARRTLVTGGLYRFIRHPALRGRADHHVGVYDCGWDASGVVSDGIDRNRHRVAYCSRGAKACRRCRPRNVLQASPLAFDTQNLVDGRTPTVEL